MCIKGDDVLHAHGLQLLQGHGAVQALADHTAVLTAAVQAGHDDGHAVCLACHSLDETLEVCKMVIRGEMVLIAEQIIGDAVVARVHDNVDIIAAHRLLDEALGVAALETGALGGDDERLLINASFVGPAHQMVVDEVGEFLGTGAADQAQVSDLRLQKTVLRVDGRHSYTP